MPRLAGDKDGRQSRRRSRPDFAGDNRRLFLVSDLLQYAPGNFTLYESDQNWDAYRT